MCPNEYCPNKRSLSISFENHLLFWNNKDWTRVICLYSHVLSFCFGADCAVNNKSSFCENRSTTPLRVGEFSASAWRLHYSASHQVLSVRHQLILIEKHRPCVVLFTSAWDYPLIYAMVCRNSKPCKVTVCCALGDTFLCDWCKNRLGLCSRKCGHSTNSPRPDYWYKQDSL